MSDPHVPPDEGGQGPSNAGMSQAGLDGREENTITSSTVVRTQQIAPEEAAPVKSFADTMKNSSSSKKPKPKIIKTTTVAEDLAEMIGKGRSYSLVRNPPPGYKYFLLKKFPSMSSCTLNKYKSEGSYLPTLEIGFNPSMETYEVDYENSKTIEWTFKEKNGLKKVVWKAIEDDKVDENGSLVARIVKTMTIIDVPWNVSKRIDVIKDALKDYVEFSDDIHPEMIVENGVYSGRMMFSITKFKKIPRKKFEIPAINKVNGEYKVDEVAKVQVLVRCAGFDPETPFEPEGCRYCNDPLHKVADCPAIKKKEARKANRKGFTCNICGGHDSKKCNRDECGDIDAIENGNFSVKPKPEIKEKKSIRIGSTPRKKKDQNGKTGESRSILKRKRDPEVDEDGFSPVRNKNINYRRGKKSSKKSVGGKTKPIGPIPGGTIGGMDEYGIIEQEEYASMHFDDARSIGSHIQDENRFRHLLDQVSGDEMIDDPNKDNGIPDDPNQAMRDSENSNYDINDQKHPSDDESVGLEKMNNDDQ